MQTLFFYLIVLGIPAAVAFGLVFAFLISAFVAQQASKFKGQCSLSEGESLVKEGPANHLVRVEGVGGWLYLTSLRLHFRSHKLNIQNHELSIPLGDIPNTKTRLTAGIIPNGLLVGTARGSERFVVNGARSWVAAIERAKPETA